MMVPSWRILDNTPELRGRPKTVCASVARPASHCGGGGGVWSTQDTPATVFPRPERASAGLLTTQANVSLVLAKRNKGSVQRWAPTAASGFGLKQVIQMTADNSR
jgi:hypothetical protein